jgi:hypothetical protein
MEQKNKADYTNNYLAKKLEKAVEQQPVVKSCSHGKRAGPSLPIDVIVSICGIKHAVIVDYLAGRIIDYTHARIHSPP